MSDRSEHELDLAVSDHLQSLGSRTDGVAASQKLLVRLRDLSEERQGGVWSGVLRLAAPSLVLASVTLALVFGVGRALEPSFDDDVVSAALEDLP